MTLIDLLYSQIKEHHPKATITKLDDESGQVISIPKRKGKIEYMIDICFDGKGIEFKDVKIYCGEVIESIEHKEVV